MNAKQRRTAARRSKPKLTPNDHRELEMFRTFLADSGTMPRGQLYQKHQAYLGLSDAELARAAAPSE